MSTSVQEVPAPAHNLFVMFPALEAWCLAGTLSTDATVSTNLRLYVVEQVNKQAWGEHTGIILLALLRTRQVAVGEGVKVNVAAMHVIRSYTEESQQQLRTALAEHAPQASFRAGIASPTASQASVLVDMRDALTERDADTDREDSLRGIGVGALQALIPTPPRGVQMRLPWEVHLF